jgi:hypothetical protein
MTPGADLADNALPEGIPGRRISFRIDRMNSCFAESFFTMLDDGRELGQRHEFKRLNEVLFFAGLCRAATPFAARVRLFPVHPFPDEIGGAFCARFVSSFEDDSVAKIQHGDFGLILGSKGREERELRLRCHHGGGVGLADDVDVRIRLGNEALRFVLPANEKIVFPDWSLGGRSWIEAAQDMGVKEQLQYGRDVSPFGLIFLWHRETNNGAIVQR